MACRRSDRFCRQAGIALGPVLFIIALLAIVAAAIASSSGSFNASTTSEGNRTKAAAILQIGENLKIGMDRLVIDNEVPYSTWVIDPVNTVNNVDLFSPIGGGISAPSTTMSGNPQGDTWYYPMAAIPNIGTYSANAANVLQLAVLNVAQGVCAEINNRANGRSVAPAAAELGNFQVPFSSGNIAASTSANWPSTNNATSLNLYSRPIGCVQNSNTASSGYFFYQILYSH